MNKPWRVYLLLCRDNSYYTGATSDVGRRVARHNAGQGSKYVRSRRPAYLLAVSGPLSQRQALQLEARVKRLPRADKLRAVLQA